jgi:hypothetical protein
MTVVDRGGALGTMCLELGWPAGGFFGSQRTGTLQRAAREPTARVRLNDLLRVPQVEGYAHCRGPFASRSPRAGHIRSGPTKGSPRRNEPLALRKRPIRMSARVRAPRQLGLSRALFSELMGRAARIMPLFDVQCASWMPRRMPTGRHSVLLASFREESCREQCRVSPWQWPLRSEVFKTADLF